MRRRALWLLAVPMLALMLGAAASGWLLGSEAGLRWAWQRLAPLLDGQLSIEALHGRLLGPLRLEGVRWAHAGQSAAVARLDVDWQPRQLVRSRFEISTLHLQGVAIVLPVGAETKQQEANAETLPQAIMLPLDVAVDEASIDDLDLIIGAQKPVHVDRLRLAANWTGEKLQVSNLLLHAPWGEFSVAGLLATGGSIESDLRLRWALDLDPEQWELPLQSRLAVAGDARLTGRFQTPRIDLQLNAPADLRLDGEIVWREQPARWRMNFTLADTDPSALDRSLPALHLAIGGALEGAGDHLAGTVSGTLAQAQSGRWDFAARLAHADGELRLEDGRLAGTGEVQIEGRWNLAQKQGDLNLRWRALMHALLADWRSDGELIVDGGLDAYRGRLTLDLEQKELADFSASVQFQGNQTALDLDALALEGMGGRLDGALSLDWSEGLSWRSDLRAQDLALSRFEPRLPNALSGELKLSGRYADAVFLNLDSVELRSGRSKLTAEGELGQDWRLGWRLDAADLRELWKDAAGSVQLQGQIDGARAAPRLQAQGKANAIEFADAGLASAELQLDLGLAEAARWRAQLDARGLRYQTQTLEHLRGRLSGQRDAHRITLLAQGGIGDLDLAARGGWSAGAWMGELQSGRWRLEDWGDWRALPAPLHLSGGEATLKPWCWQGQGDICLSLDKGERRWQASVAVAELPLSLLEPWLPRSGFALSGRLGGALVAQGEAADLEQLVGRFGTGDAQVVYQLPEERLETALPLFALHVDGDVQGLRGALEMGGDDGHTTLELALPDWLPGQRLAEAQPLQGRFVLTAESLGWLSYIEPNLLQPAGRLQADVRLVGTLAEPVLRGGLDLQDGAVLLPAAGIALRGVELHGRSRDGRSLWLQGAAQSGEGSLELKGKLKAEQLDRWRVELALNGENFELMRRVQARVLISPALQIIAQAGGADASGQVGSIQIGGTLSIPQADINLPRLPSTVSVSGDEIILDAEEEAMAQRWGLGMDLTLSIGERVRLEGYGFSGRLSGDVSMRGNSLEQMHANGEVNVHDGRYEAYGQNLRVQRGRLLFLNSSLDNPGLDVRAVRPLIDPDQIVGVEVSGRMKDPRLRLFSEPALEESEALAWLVLGRPLNTASGADGDALYRAAFMLGGARAARGIALQFGLDEISFEQGASSADAAVVLGKYLTPRMYLQYIAGLWDAGNSLRLRYQLSSRWSLKLEQGSANSGADVNYVIER